MQKLTFITLICLLFSLAGCNNLPFFFGPEDEYPEAPSLAVDTSEATSVIQELQEELRHEKRLHLERSKVFFDEGIRTFQLEFISQDIIEMCEARKLIVDVVESLLAKLNQNGPLAAEFYTFPFTADNLEIYIVLESYFGRFIDERYISWIGMEEGEVYYYTFEIDDNEKRCWHAKHETYSTSREIVVYQREAERRYKEAHKPPIEIFGNQRFVPKETDSSM